MKALPDVRLTWTVSQPSRMTFGGRKSKSLPKPPFHRLKMDSISFLDMGLVLKVSYE